MAKKSLTIWEATKVGSPKYALRADGKIIRSLLSGRWTLIRQPESAVGFKLALAARGFTFKETPGARVEFLRQQDRRRAYGSRKRL